MDNRIKAAAARCLNCKNRPCVAACPLHNDIPKIISLINAGDLPAAYAETLKTNPFPGITSRVCPAECRCEGACTLARTGNPVDISGLEKFISESGHRVTSGKIASAGNIAIVGGGASGLAAAAALIRRGYNVTVFEKENFLGGVMIYGIPDFVLPRAVVEGYISDLVKRGVDVKTGVKITDLKELLRAYSAVYAAPGANVPNKLNVPGEDLPGVYTAYDYLYKFNFGGKISGKKVVVAGGGNVAIDAARCAVRSGAEDVTVIYRRDREQMPARSDEVETARSEGVKFRFLTMQTRLAGEKKITGAECVKMRLTDKKDARGALPEACGEKFTLPCDLFISAAGYSADAEFLVKNGLKAKNGFIETDGCRTSVKGVFAGGDVSRGPATVAEAIADGVIAADIIDKYISGT